MDKLTTIDVHINNIKGQEYKLNQLQSAVDLLDWCNFAKIGEYTRFYNKLVYKNEDGIFACYAEDHDNFWRI